MVKQLNVLLIEDNPGDVRLTEIMLCEPSDLEINLTVADSLAAAFKYIAAENLHVILLDLNLPDSAGIDTFRQVKAFAMNLPIIILSVLSDKELIYQAMQEGAQDYLVKGEIQNESLIRSISYAIWSYHTA